MPEWTREQRAAIETDDRAVTLIAGAGSGKTTVLVERYLRHLERGASPYEILAVTFTVEAAAQLRRRVAERWNTNGGSDDTATAIERTPYLGTLHSFCFQMLDQMSSILELPPIERIASSFEVAEAFDDAYREWLGQLTPDTYRAFLRYYSHRDLRSLVRQLYQDRSLFKKLPLPEENLGEEGSVLVLLREHALALIKTLEVTLLGRGLYGFDDLEQLTLQIFEQSPETALRMRNQFRHLLVDEFQDTSEVQWRILSHLIGEDRHKLFVVGDPKQSIYRFRNADVSLFLSVAETLRETGGEALALTANFRSQPSLLQEINRLSHPLFATSAIPFLEMAAGREAAPCTPVEVLRFEAGEKRAEGNEAELRLVIDSIRRRMDEGIAPHQIALLFRASDKIPLFATRLNEAGIPTCAKRTRSLFATYDIIDAISYLRSLSRPQNDFEVACFLRSRFIDMDLAHLEAIQRRPGETLREKLVSAKELSWFTTLGESGAALPIHQALRLLFKNTSYWPDQLAAFFELLAPLSTEEFTVDQAVKKIAAWQKEGILFQENPTDRLENAVQLMTVHGAKGLEFPHVYLVDNLRQMPRRYPVLRMHPGHPPALRYRQGAQWVSSERYEKIQELDREEDIEESKRILYVALTRAQETLTICLPTDPRQIPKNSWADWLQ